MHSRLRRPDVVRRWNASASIRACGRGIYTAAAALARRARQQTVARRRELELDPIPDIRVPQRCRSCLTGLTLTISVIGERRFCRVLSSEIVTTVSAATYTPSLYPLDYLDAQTSRCPLRCPPWPAGAARDALSFPTLLITLAHRQATVILGRLDMNINDLRRLHVCCQLAEYLKCTTPTRGPRG